MIHPILRRSSDINCGAKVAAPEEDEPHEFSRSRSPETRVRDLARLLGVSPQQIYKMAASGRIPSFKVANAVRFDPMTQLNG